MSDFDDLKDVLDPQELQDLVDAGVVQGPAPSPERVQARTDAAGLRADLAVEQQEEEARAQGNPFTDNLLHVGQNMLAGGGDELYAGGAAVADWLGNGDESRSYQEHLADIRNELAASQERNPYTTTFVAPAIPQLAGLAGGGMKAAVTAAKSGLGQLAKVGAQGGALGGGAAYASADDGHRLEAVPMGALTGAGLAVAAGKAGQAAQKSPTLQRPVGSFVKQGASFAADKAKSLARVGAKIEPVVSMVDPRIGAGLRLAGRLAGKPQADPAPAKASTPNRVTDEQLPQLPDYYTRPQDGPQGGPSIQPGEVGLPTEPMTLPEFTPGHEDVGAGPSIQATPYQRPVPDLPIEYLPPEPRTPPTRTPVDIPQEPPYMEVESSSLPAPKGPRNFDWPNNPYAEPPQPSTGTQVGRTKRPPVSRAEPEAPTPEKWFRGTAEPDFETPFVADELPPEPVGPARGGGTQAGTPKARSKPAAPEWEEKTSEYPDMAEEAQERFESSDFDALFPHPTERPPTVRTQVTGDPVETPGVRGFVQKHRAPKTPTAPLDLAGLQAKYADPKWGPAKGYAAELMITKNVTDPKVMQKALARYGVETPQQAQEIMDLANSD